ncbi:MAG: MBL fold metallo-hydrolase [Deltaproteobacteria bacterium]|nr:MBL fold metallo-hydrolase [Deltaproteobacteria bacterium]MBW2128456.1 MBL fold metallo-hydrolase [Deltaproteobacteria bacterium]
MRFSVLASGSGGNACYVETPSTGVVIDAGLSSRELIRRLRIIGVDSSRVNALVITHEHLDHIKGAGPLARRLDIPVFINGATLKRGWRALGNLSRPIPLHTGQAITIGDLILETFTKCHDAADPMGVVISANGNRLGLVTDLGRSSPVVEDRIRGCRGLILEFNHDEKMLEQGPYPLALKRRIKGPDGHLSNRQAGRLLKSVAHEKLAWVVLAHLSEANNLPDKALKEAEKALNESGRGETKILVSTQDEPLPLVDC